MKHAALCLVLDTNQLPRVPKSSTFARRLEDRLSAYSSGLLLKLNRVD